MIRLTVAQGERPMTRACAGADRAPETKRRIMAVLAAATLWLAASPSLAQTVTGSGSTFVQPLLNRWSQDHLRSLWTAESQPAGGLDYEAIGSQAGIMRLKDRAVDFGATESPLSSEELKRYGVAQFPIVIGGIVAAVNVAGVPDGQLKLTGALLADIYLGRIKSWSDPAIKAVNPDLALPDAQIVPVRRSDGSGTTFTFTSFLAKANAAWNSVGVGLLVSWPVGVQAKGNDGIAEAVKRTANAIGYLDYASARRAGLATAALRNGAGAFIAASPVSFQAAAATAQWGGASDFGLSLVDAPGEAAYPIVATTFVLVPDGKPATRATGAAIAFFDWGLERGASTAADLGYVPLPSPLVAEIRRYWSARLGLRPASEPAASVGWGRGER